MIEARTVVFTEDDLDAHDSYDDFEPGEYQGTLVDVKETSSAATGNTGLRWIFQVRGLNFSITTWDKGRGGWKLAEVLRGLGESVEPGKPIRVVPSRYLGRTATVKIGVDPTSTNNYLTILRVLPSSVEPPSSEELVDLGSFMDDDDEDPYAA